MPHPDNSAQMVLGTVQLGLPYGAANHAGMPGEAEAQAVIRRALDCGIRVLDTARAYGDSERRVGAALERLDTAPPEIVTKLHPLPDCSPDAPVADVLRAAEDSLEQSRRLLGLGMLPVLLLHRASHRTDWGGALWRMLLEHQAAGRIGRLGVSVQSTAEALAAVADPAVAHLQLPFNLLDHRWREDGVVDALRRRPDVTVHVRSVLLQGLLTGDPAARWPVIPGVSPEKIIGVLHSLARDFGRAGVIDLCMAYARGQDWIDGIVIGMETEAQVIANAALFAKPALTPESCARIHAAAPRCPETFLDPARWPAERQSLQNKEDHS